MPSVLSGRKFLTNLGGLIGGGVMPSMSCITMIWPSTSGPAPMPITGISSAPVIARARSTGTHSSSRTLAPARSSSSASSIMASAWLGSRPWTRKPPRRLMDCGVRPMCAHTGMPRSASLRVVSAIQAPPSSLTMCAPARISAAALSSACSSWA